MDKKPPRRKSAKASPARAPTPPASIEAAARWRRSQRYAWDKGGARGGRR
ncbi:MAG TPA: hypothetical protein PKC23_08000 [Candidatus Desulfobacillus sp.]|nr:hypothetical protein [Candidatus Desulfobacillus sp.]